MHSFTTHLRRLFVLAVLLGVATNAHAQRTVTVRLNTATLPDTLSPSGVIKVMGDVNEGAGGVAPYTLPDGNIISWTPSGDGESTLVVENVGGDYWETSFQIPNEATTQFKFHSIQAQADGVDGWEADPNPTIGPGTSDTTLTLHYFESNFEWHGESGDRGPYDWRPFESKEDSVAVLFRVAMNGAESNADGYDVTANAPAQIIGVRGDPATGVIDWGATNVHLERESTTANQPANRMYSGVAYFPASAAGSLQEYKFVIDGENFSGGNAWEEGDLAGNRSFTIPSEDTTLHWVFYGNTAPSPAVPVEGTVIFTVDLRPFEEIGLFDLAAGDTLWVFGSFNGWDGCPTLNPDDCLMQRVPGETQFEIAVPMSEFIGRQFAFKYFLDFNDETFTERWGSAPPDGWEEGHATGTDRFFNFAGDANQFLDLHFFNDITVDNVIPEGNTIDVHFTVDMNPAIDNQARPFDPATDSVYIRLTDPHWAFTQGVVGEGHPPTHSFLDDEDGDGIYTGTFTVSGPTYSGLTFRYVYGVEGDATDETGTGTTEPGRSRVHYIRPNQDGSWPSEYTLPDHVFNLAGPLPFETNPAFATAVEPVAGELPSRITLGQNYPNPFNPSTAFEYGLTSTEHVTVRVFDALGRVVATLVDEVQTASTYRVTFDANQLASGVYLYQLKTPSQVMSRTMVLVR